MLPQCRTHAQFINDYIADHSVRHVAAGDGAGSGVADGGWEWCFDPLKMQKLGALANPSPKLGAQAFDQTRLSSSGDDNTGTERIDYTYSAVWRFPNKELSDTLEAGAKAVGFLEYFDQVNFSGTMISPQALNQHMINL